MDALKKYLQDRLIQSLGQKLERNEVGVQELQHGHKGIGAHGGEARFVRPRGGLQLVRKDTGARCQYGCMCLDAPSLFPDNEGHIARPVVEQRCYISKQGARWERGKLVSEEPKVSQGHDGSTNLKISFDRVLCENSVVPPKKYMAESMTQAE
jgi:hypothetical protein